MINLKMVNGETRAEIHVNMGLVLGVQKIDEMTKEIIMVNGPSARWTRQYCYTYGNFPPAPEEIPWHVAQGFLRECNILP